MVSTGCVLAGQTKGWSNGRGSTLAIPSEPFPAPRPIPSVLLLRKGYPLLKSGTACIVTSQQMHMSRIVMISYHRPFGRAACPRADLTVAAPSLPAHLYRRPVLKQIRVVLGDLLLFLRVLVFAPPPPTRELRS